MNNQEYSWKGNILAKLIVKSTQSTKATECHDSATKFCKTTYLKVNRFILMEIIIFECWEKS